LTDQVRFKAWDFDRVVIELFDDDYAILRCVASPVDVGAHGAYRKPERNRSGGAGLPPSSGRLFVIDNERRLAAYRPDSGQIETVASGLPDFIFDSLLSESVD
jgi:hypothetical protein